MPFEMLYTVYNVHGKETINSTMFGAHARPITANEPNLSLSLTPNLPLA